MLKKIIAFADGENLVARYQAMLDSGREKLDNQVEHLRDVFVWSHQISPWSHMDLLRVNYYASVVGDEDKVKAAEAQIAAVRFKCAGPGMAGEGQLLPRVHKRHADVRKSKVVDVDITMDVMRAALEMPVDGILLLTGDGDYAPLLREISRRTSKQVYLAAFSSGLAPGLRSSVDDFIDLDGKFFKP